MKLTALRGNVGGKLAYRASESGITPEGRMPEALSGLRCQGFLHPPERSWGRIGKASLFARFPGRPNATDRYTEKGRDQPCPVGATAGLTLRICREGESRKQPQEIQLLKSRHDLVACWGQAGQAGRLQKLPIAN